MARKQQQTAAPASHGYSGGFFLPAQRSMHCKGGFFSTDAKPMMAMPPPTSTKSKPSTTPMRRAETTTPVELALKELRDIKGEYQRTRPPSSGSAQQPPTPEVQSTPEPATDGEVATTRNVPLGDHSPNKKLKIAEMVIRKLYKKNLELEKALGQAKAELLTAAQSAAPYQPQLEKPPTAESVQVIESQKEEYLKYLAAEQDKTIQELRRKIEELSGSDAMEQQKPGKASSSAAVISRLQKRLQEAIGESSRQKSSYMKLKSDYKRLLLQRTRTISGSSEVDNHARDLLALMEKRLLKVEDEREQDMALYNMKLFETEQKNCDDYVAKKMLENEMQKVTKDARDREDLDNQIEKCMFAVFERLHQVEQENLRLREAHGQLAKAGR